MSILNLENITLQFNGASQAALKNVCYQIYSGDFVILLGSNGSGKSSLLKLFYRQYQPDSGKIILLKKALDDYSEKELSQHISILTQNCSDSLFTSLTIYENYLLIKKHKKEKKFLIEYLYDFNPNLIHKLDVPVKNLSGGEMQALALAFCFLKPPSLLLLDEHTSALDPKTSEQIMELTQRKIKEHHITCILTTHNLDIAMRYGNRILALNAGKIHKMVDSENKIKMTKEELMGSYF